MAKLNVRIQGGPILKKTIFLIVATLSISTLAAGQRTANRVADNEKEAILLLEKQNDRATLSADAKVLDRLYADDFAGTAANGLKTNKELILGAFGPKHNTVKECESDDMQIRVFGTAAIVTARLKYRNSDEGDPTWMRYTRIYVKRGKNWVVISEHFCMLDNAPRQ
jgi:ketosteroid isomerase-like protein